ncbi:fumarylacetoacetate hydrolase family protein [Gracilinema caldarium]|uniref:Ureidoglycolate lyase n=1 Tax=Gracilinema caldarium (strain ATCC 51460 / DSM 7334 / H1) TaxID=744872 RepID=F8F1Q6_GRAC1|nr:fumarylacetoacetate hydrolase family protein [Gracilinema caldarium]AEJ19390.1 Ureidoglycolate lyase [Gracilinema caldarium DSM 7334]
MVSLLLKGADKMITLTPSKIIAVGLNYHAHVQESKVFDLKKLEVPTEPVLFAKTPNVLVGPNEPIVIPAFLKEYHFDEPRVDPEAELAIIIGKKCRHVLEHEALDYVLGYTCFNDVSQRNIQKLDASGWFRGKSFDTFGPIGPVIVPPSLLPDPQRLAITCRINGKTTQAASTADMIFSIKKLIAFISINFTLEAGDIIATGTPSGVSPIKAGDEVEVEIEGIGILRNPVIEEVR